MADPKDAAPDAAETRRRNRICWISTLGTLSLYFALMLLVPLNPGWLGSSLTPGSFWTFGMILGIACLVILIAGAAIYTKWANKLESRE